MVAPLAPLLVIASGVGLGAALAWRLRAGAAAPQIGPLPPSTTPMPDLPPGTNPALRTDFNAAVASLRLGQGDPAVLMALAARLEEAGLTAEATLLRGEIARLSTEQGTAMQRRVFLAQADDYLARYGLNPVAAPRQFAADFRQIAKELRGVGEIARAEQLEGVAARIEAEIGPDPSLLPLRRCRAGTACRLYPRAAPPPTSSFTALGPNTLYRVVEEPGPNDVRFGWTRVMQDGGPNTGWIRSSELEAAQVDRRPGLLGMPATGARTGQMTVYANSPLDLDPAYLAMMNAVTRAAWDRYHVAYQRGLSPAIIRSLHAQYVKASQAQGLDPVLGIIGAEFRLEGLFVPPRDGAVRVLGRAAQRQAWAVPSQGGGGAVQGAGTGQAAARLTVRGRCNQGRCNILRASNGRLYSVAYGAPLLVSASAPDGTMVPVDANDPRRGVLAYVVLSSGLAGWMSPDAIQVAP